MAIKIVFVIFAENKREVGKSEKIEARRTNLYVFHLCSLLFYLSVFALLSLLLALKKTQL